MYRSVFKLPLIWTKGGVHVEYPVTSQIIAPSARPLCLYQIQVANVGSSWSLQTRMRASENSSYNRDLSEKTTLWHSWIQLCRSAHQSRRISLCCIVKGSLSNSHRADKLRRCKCRRTIWAETGLAANMPISWLMVRDVVIRFYRPDLKISLSSGR